MRFPLVSKPRDWWRGLFARVAGKPRDMSRHRRWLQGWNHADEGLVVGGATFHACLNCGCQDHGTFTCPKAWPLAKRTAHLRRAARGEARPWPTTRTPSM